MPPEPASPTATALLRHEPRDAPPHVDWLLDLPLPTPDHLRGDGGRVPTFRLAERPDALSAGAAIDAERLADHRRLYLDLAEPRELSEQRGLVVPLRHGLVVESSLDGSGAIDLAIDWRGGAGPARQRLRLSPRGGDRWSLAVRSAW